MEEQAIQFEKSKQMDDFLKDWKISKYIRKNVSADFPSVLQFNGIPIIKEEKNVIIHYSPPAGIKLTYRN